jgi:hypothetical protein
VVNSFKSFLLIAEDEFVATSSFDEKFIVSSLFLSRTDFIEYALFTHPKSAVNNLRRIKNDEFFFVNRLFNLL